ncbi:MAG: AtzE family amidohydrolase [Bradyrhizobiaceae bacterium]|nr:MAG: AtzE family amidohydrolase [Bradyrhizobiaceae bacterium]
MTSNPQIHSRPDTEFGPFVSAGEIASAVASGKISATRIVETTLNRIREDDKHLNSFTDLLSERAIERAKNIDASIAKGEPVGPLAGVPFAVKNLFDVKGLTTRAGSKINRDNPPARRDATLIERLEAAGAICVGALNMGEYAYDFTGENIHDGNSRNPHDTSRMTGGSSGGSGAAVAGGLVPVALGSDTNGSIRVPSSFCGIFGLKPSYGRLPRTRTFPFVSSLDHVGPLARNVADLVCCYDAMQGPDPGDPVCSPRMPEPAGGIIARGAEGLRIAVAGGYFQTGLYQEAQSAIEKVARALNATAVVEIPEAARARAAAYVITNAEGASLHLDRLRERPDDFDPAVRDRLLASALLPAVMIDRAQKFRRWYRSQVLDLFRSWDVILAPATPCVAPKIGQVNFEIGGKQVPVRANIGLYTQPLSFIGLPIAVAPIPLDPLPIGVQIIAAPWREDLALRVAFALEQMGIAASKRPRTQAEHDAD